VKLLHLWFRISYWLHQRQHGACEVREIRAWHTGYIRGAQDERSLIYNAKLEAQLRQIIADSERPAA
jgi:hypothetical protein